MAIDRQTYLAEKLLFNDNGIFFRNEASSIMESWEKPFIEEYIQRYLVQESPKTVLEVGYGLGYTAQIIHNYGVDTHYIVEPHPEIIANLEKWAENKPNVTVIRGFVEDVTLPKEVDFIFDDRYRFPSDDAWIKKVKHKFLLPLDFKDMMKMTERQIRQYLASKDGDTYLNLSGD